MIEILTCSNLLLGSESKSSQKGLKKEERLSRTKLIKLLRSPKIIKFFHNIQLLLDKSSKKTQSHLQREASKTLLLVVTKRKKKRTRAVRAEVTMMMTMTLVPNSLLHLWFNFTRPMTNLMSLKKRMKKSRSS